MPQRWQQMMPYVIVLAICGYLFYLATGIQYNGPPGRIGPDFWPKLVLVLAIATCCYEIVRQALIARERGPKNETAPAAPEAVEESETPLYPRLLWSGVALTVGYLLLIERIGFFLCTFLYLAGFMLIGRYRRWGVVLVTSFVGALTFMFVFMKVVYVSLPLGQGPFMQVSFALMKLMAIR